MELVTIGAVTIGAVMLKDDNPLPQATLYPTGDFAQSATLQRRGGSAPETTC